MNRRWFSIILIMAAAAGLGGFVLIEAGAWLVIEDPLQPAPVAVVLGGKVPFRAMEAARIYKDGTARQVWLTQGGLFLEDVALAELGIDKTPEYAYSRSVLERMGVPDDAIRVLPERNNNTAQEVRSIARELDRAGIDRVILVTSSYHTRRVKALWRKVVGKQPQAIVRYTRDDPFESHRWWRDAADGLTVVREWFGLLNAWTGFPIKSEHW